MGTIIGRDKPHIRSEVGHVGAPETGDAFATVRSPGWSATWTEGYSYRSSWSPTFKGAVETCAQWWAEGRRISATPGG